MLWAVGYQAGVHNEQSMGRDADCEGQVSQERCFLRAHSFHPLQVWRHILHTLTDLCQQHAGMPQMLQKHSDCLHYIAGSKRHVSMCACCQDWGFLQSFHSGTIDGCVGMKASNPASLCSRNLAVGKKHDLAVCAETLLLVVTFQG